MKIIEIIVSVFVFSFSLQAKIEKPPPLQLDRRSFMEIADCETKNILEKILRHPFLQELAMGTLPQEKFDYYLKQDKLYDWKYANVLLYLSSKSEEPALKRFLVTAANHSTGNWETEIPDELKQCPSCEAYSDFERLYAYETLSIGVASVAPCYTIYWKVAVWLKENSVANNPYQGWINGYSNLKYEDHVDNMIKTLNSLASDES